MSVLHSKKQIKEILKFPNNALITATDTVYGILSTSIETIEEIKLREHGKKKIVKLIGNISQMGKNLPEDLLKISKKFWPGPLTIIYKRVGYRIPNNDLILELLKEIDFIYASSANITNKKTVETIEEAKEVFKNSKSNIYYLQNDSKQSKISSTVFDYDNLKILREGEIKSEEILSLVERN